MLVAAIAVLPAPCLPNPTSSDWNMTMQPTVALAGTAQRVISRPLQPSPFSLHPAYLTLTACCCKQAPTSSDWNMTTQSIVALAGMTQRVISW